MAWVKQKCIFKTAGNFPWSRTHTQVPTVLVLADRLRLYYATRDSQGRSLTSFIETSRQDPSKIIYCHDRPILPLGEPGTHDEDGVMVGSIVAQGEEVLCYYTGWSKGQTVPYRVSVGLAKSNDGGVTFTRAYQGPIVDRTPLEPYMTMSPYVMHHQGLWKMWYGSGIKWVAVEDKMEPIYVIKYAQSIDGHEWFQKDTLAIPQAHPLEANTRPSVLVTNKGYHMWFSYRHSLDFRDGKGAYRIGYATSPDGLNWQRQPEQSGLEPSNEGWDAQMIAYPNVVEVDGRRLLFYNGNSFGKSGFGYAVWQD